MTAAAGPTEGRPRDPQDEDDDIKGTVMTVSSSSGQEAASGAVTALGSTQLQTLLLRLIRGGLSTKGAAKEAARLVPGLGRKEAYAMALELASASKREGKIMGMQVPGAGGTIEESSKSQVPVDI